MKYKIYSLEYPEHLQKHEPDGYHMKQIDRAVFEDIHVGCESEFDTSEDAYKHIQDNSKNLKGRELCVLPVIKVDYKGDLT
jgi:hypothetical protein